MVDGGGDGGSSFKVKYESDAAEVTEVHDAGVGEFGDVVGEREMKIKSNIKIAGRSIRGESSGRRVIGQVY